MELDLTGLVLPQRVEVSERRDGGRTAQFVIAPLERGFGQTLGNSVRRILLSSLPGAAVWGFRMDGVVHEHQTVEGVVEDVHQIIQNLKTLVLAFEDETLTEATLELRAERAGPVTARNIEDTGQVRIISADHHLFTLQDDRTIHMTLYVDRGRGFVQADTHPLKRKDREGKERDMPVDLVRVDSIYNPVLRANFTVEETRVGQRTDFDRLTVLVETNGSMSPDEAIAQAAELARRHLHYLLRFSEPAKAPPANGERVSPQMRDLLRRSIDELTELSVRSVNSLKKENIITLGDLVQRTEEQMLNIENFGVKSLEEIREFLAKHNLHFGIRLEEAEDGELYRIEQQAHAEPVPAEAAEPGAAEAAEPEESA